VTEINYDFLDHLETYGPIAKSLSMCLRPTFCAEDENHTLVWGDWSSIEAPKSARKRLSTLGETTISGPYGSGLISTRRLITRMRRRACRIMQAV